MLVRHASDGSRSGGTAADMARQLDARGEADGRSGLADGAAWHPKGDQIAAERCVAPSAHTRSWPAASEIDPL